MPNKKVIKPRQKTKSNAQGQNAQSQNAQSYKHKVIKPQCQVHILFSLKFLFVFISRNILSYA